MEERVESVMREVLKQLKEGRGDLTIVPNPERNFLLTEEDLLRDFEIFADEVFEAEREQMERAIKLRFKNGQIFLVKVEEVTI